MINASGRMSILGVSVQSETVTEAMKHGSQSYVEMADLIEKSGEYIARKLGAEAAVVVNSASSGIVLSVAGIVTRGNRYLSEKLHQEVILKNKIMILKGHNVNYGAPISTMICLGGGTPLEVGYVNEGKKEHLEDAVTENIAAILYVQSHHSVQKNMISLKEAYEVAKKYQIPFIVDAAAEENVTKYVKYSDLVIYSGSKAIEGPTSGIVAGKKMYVNWVKVQLHYIGRSMKVGKEAIFGLLQAIDEFVTKRENTNHEQETLQILLTLNDLDGVKVTIIQDEAGRNIYRGRIYLNPKQTKLTAEEMVGALREGEIAIYTRDYGAKQGYFDIDPRPLQGKEINIIVAKIRELIGGRK